VSDTVLPLWRDGATRAAIISFLDRVDEIPPRDRVAVFDNDGTMWAEKPNYTQLDFMVHELKAAVASRPELADVPAYRALIEHDMKAVGEMGLEGVANALLDLFTGISPRSSTPRSRSSSPSRSTPSEECTTATRGISPCSS
jgi:hypothetical protein